MKRSSTLFFQPYDNYSGSVRVLAGVIEQDYANQIVYVISSSGSKGFLSELPNVRVVHFFNPRFKSKKLALLNSLIWRFSAYIITFFLGLCFDTFYINTIVPDYAAKIGHFFRKRIIYHVHEKFVVSTRGIRIAEKTFNKVPAHRIFVSYYLKNQYRDNPNCTSEVRYNKLSKSFLANVNPKPIEQRNRNNIIMLSSLLIEKGSIAIVELAKSMPDYKFVYIINASKEKIEEFYSGKCIPSNIKLVDRQNNIHPFLHDADLNINLSNPNGWIETFGMTILEAMAYGIPSVAPDAGGPLEIIENGKNGYCIDVTNSKLLIETIRFILDQKNYKNFVENTFKKFHALNDL